MRFAPLGRHYCKFADKREKGLKRFATIPLLYWLPFVKAGRILRHRIQTLAGTNGSAHKLEAFVSSDASTQVLSPTNRFSNQSFWGPMS
jgi:hypothetical protein